MAEAIIRVTDAKGGVNVEIKLSPAMDQGSAAHQLVAKFIEAAGLEQLDAQLEPAAPK
jgi:hypothetical protein